MPLFITPIVLHSYVVCGRNYAPLQGSGGRSGTGATLGSRVTIPRMDARARGTHHAPGTMAPTTPESEKTRRAFGGNRRGPKGLVRAEASLPGLSPATVEGAEGAGGRCI